MRFELIAAALAAAIAAGMTAHAMPAETAEAGDISLLTEEYPLSVELDEERQVYTYSFNDEASFSATSLLHIENTLPYLWIATEDDDVEIRISRDNEAYAYSPTSVINAEGEYSVTVSHELRGSGQLVEATFSAAITETQDIVIGGDGETIPEPITGRMVLELDNSGLYHDFIGGARLRSSVLDGEVVSTPAEFTIPEDISVSAMRDGEVFSFPANGIIEEPGRYRLTFTSTSEDGGLERRSMEFRICGEAVNSLGIYQPPFGAELVDVTVDGVQEEFSGSFFNCERDGRYVFTCEYKGMRRSTAVNVDTRAPVLKFNGTADITFMEPVTVTSDTPCTYTIYKNGQPTDNSTVLTGTGVFRIYAEDAAGNMSSYRVEIKAVSAVDPMNFAVIGLAIAAGGTGYFVWNRNRKIRVR